jgi:hypothetical protein
MPTLDRRLLAWSDSDAEDDDRPLATPAGRRGLGGSYDRCAAAALVDDVLVPAGADADDGRRAGKPPGTRKVSTYREGI